MKADFKIKDLLLYPCLIFILGDMFLCSVLAQDVALNVQKGYEFIYQGEIFIKERNWPKALVELTRAEEIFKKTDDPIALFNVYRNKGFIFLNQERYEYADSTLANAIFLLNFRGSQIPEGYLPLLASVYFYKAQANVGNNYAESIRCAENALQLFEKSADHAKRVQCAKFLIPLYEFLQEDHKVAEMKKITDHYAPELGLNYNQTVQNCIESFNEKDFNSALEFAQQALSMTSNTSDSAYCLGLIGSIYFQKSQPVLCLDLSKRALDLWKKKGNKREIILQANSIGFAYYTYGDYTESIKYFSEACNLISNMSLADHGWYAYYGLGNCYSSNGEIQKAVQAYINSIALIEHVRSNLVSAKHKQIFLGEKIDVYNRLIALLIKNKDYVKALEYADRCRARAFLDMLGTKNFLKSKDKIIGDRFEKILSDASFNPITSDSDIEQNSDFNERTILSDLNKRHLEISSFYTVPLVDLASVQAKLNQSTALIYYHYDEKLYIWIISRNSCDFVQGDIGSVKSNAIDFLNQVEQTIIDYEFFGGLFYHFLIEPIKDHLKDYTRLGIIPCGILHYLPFSAFWDGNHFLIENYELFYLPSLNVYNIILNKRKKLNNKILAVANTQVDQFPAGLRYTIDEVEIFKSIFSNPAILMQRDATKKIVSQKIEAEKPDILHFACHSNLNSQQPLESYLQLVPDDSSDGKLKLEEVFKLNLEAYLVVLSSCQTSLGRLAKGDELVSLSRAFLYAGAPSVIASLWPVDDKNTPTLMNNFYGNLKRGMNKSKALRQAQLDFYYYQLGQNKETQNPYFWAPFILIGDWE